ncbi:MAG: uracil-DNA glycosylase [bacterium]|nr:uracil-DNA glycosylase [bacterium]
MGSDLKNVIYEWLMNERLLGKTTIELDSKIAANVLKIMKNESISPTDSKRPTNISSAKPDTNSVSIPTSTPTLASSKKLELQSNPELAECSKSVMECKDCELHKGRNNIVFGEGDSKSRLMFIGEAPGAEEDSTGRPFVGSAGKVLTGLLAAIGLKRENVYIANIIKCRPPANRDPLPNEIAACHHWLDKQIEIIKPKIICSLGRHSTHFLLELEIPFNKIRGNIYDYKGVKVVPIFHPAALLYHPAWRVDTEKDFQTLKKLYGEQ